MIASIAEILNVSKKAMAYRLRDLDLISEEVFLSLELDKTKKYIVATSKYMLMVISFGERKKGGQLCHTSLKLKKIATTANGRD